MEDNDFYGREKIAKILFKRYTINIFNLGSFFYGKIEK